MKSKLEEIESKYPKSFDELTKLSNEFKLHTIKSKKLLENFNQIDAKVQKIAQEIKSKVEVDETNYQSWGPKDTLRYTKS